MMKAATNIYSSINTDYLDILNYVTQDATLKGMVGGMVTGGFVCLFANFLHWNLSFR